MTGVAYESHQAFWERKENALKMKRKNAWDESRWKKQEARILACTLAAMYSEMFGWSEKVGGDKNTRVPEPQDSILAEQVLPAEVLLLQ